MRTNSVYEIIWNNSKFWSSNSVLNNSTFLGTKLTRKKINLSKLEHCVEVIHSFLEPIASMKKHFKKTVKFQSSNSLLKGFHLFANPLHLWDKLNYFRFKAWLPWLKKINLFANRFRLWNYLQTSKLSKLKELA